MGLNCMHTGTLVRPRFGVRFSERSPVSGVASRAAPRRGCRGANRKVSGASCEGNGTHPKVLAVPGFWEGGTGEGVGPPYAGRGRLLYPEDSSKKSPRSACIGHLRRALDTSNSVLNSNTVRLSVNNFGCFWGQNGLTAQHEASAAPSVV